MKKLVVIFFLLSYLTSITELNQFLKFPILFEHFNEHQSQNTSLTFLDFLSMHYSQEDDHDGDKEKDNKLPFKSHSCCNFSMSFVTLISENEIHFPVFREFYEQNSSPSFYNLMVNSSHLKDIWQPPQIV